MKYVAIIFSMSLLVVLYVWQNIEIVKIGMKYDAMAAQERKLVNDNDRLRYEIERYRRIDMIAESARKNGYREMLPGDIEIMAVRKGHAQ
jgi:hypothetical protein